MASTLDRCREALSTTDAVRLVELAADRSEWVRASVPLNPAAAQELLRTCLSDRSWRVVARVAARMAPDEQFWNDAEPLSDEVAGWLAICGELTEEWALRLAQHRNVSVRESVGLQHAVAVCPGTAESRSRAPGADRAGGVTVPASAGAAGTGRGPR